MQHIPFDYSNRRAFATKTVAYFVLGFSIPFIAAKYQMYVPRRLQPVLALTFLALFVRSKSA